MALELWTEFFTDLQQIRGRSNNTILAYRRDLELFDRYVTSLGKSFPDPGTLSDDEVLAFYQFMDEEGLSARSQARVISSIRTYLRFRESSGQKCPELRTLRPPKVKVGLPKPITRQEFERLMEACQVGAGPEESDESKSLAAARTSRNRMTLLLLYGLGCRVSELSGLDVHDYHATDRWLKILGKGQKERAVPVTDELAEELRIYLRIHRPRLLRGVEVALLINDRGHRPSRVDIWRWLAAWSQRAGFEEAIHPHRFRHGCATALLDSGADLRSIQTLLGHASIQTTQIYTAVSVPALHRTIEDHHPLSSPSIREASED
jgi:integrase/recombinase XerD